MIYGYARVSTDGQNEDRQIAQLLDCGIDERNIIIDKASGKNFERDGYLLLRDRLLRKGDELIICSLDRLGRDYTQIVQQYNYLTMELYVTVRILDLPILSGNNNTLDCRLINNIILQLLGYVAEREREAIKKRQREGIDCMPVNSAGKKYSKRTGRTVGRPAAQYPNGWDNIYKQWVAGDVTATEAMRQLGMTRSTFYKLAKRCDTV